MKLMLDTADLNEIRYAAERWPICGVTTNPSILRKASVRRPYEQLERIRALVGKDCCLHVQAVSAQMEAIVEEAHRILDRLGGDIYVKVPTDMEGIGAIRRLAAEGVGVTATAVYSGAQGVMSVLAGAKYVAIYCNRMEKLGASFEDAIALTRQCIEENHSDAQILAASFQSAEQLERAFAAGAQCATVPPRVLREVLGAEPVAKAVADFRADFEQMHGHGSTMQDCD